MITKHKQILLAALLCGISFSASAYGSPFDVTVPNQQGGFTFGGDALLMRGTAPNLGYAVLFGPPLATTEFTSVSGSLSDLDTSYQWGFDALAAYRIPGTGNSVSLAWTHLGDFSNSSTKSFIIPPTDDEDSPDSFSQNANVKFNYNSVDLDLNQLVNFGDYFNFTMFAGARWADVEEDITRNYSSTTLIDFFDGTSTFEQENNEFKGIGPQIGFTGRYCLGWGFGIDANVVASLLVGNVDSDATLSTVVLSDALVTSSDTSTLNSNDRTRVIPALDGSIGADYTYAFANCDRSSVKIQAGYKAINYFDMTEETISHTPVTADNGSFVSGFTLGNQSSNVDFDGPYVGINVNF